MVAADVKWAGEDGFDGVLVSDESDVSVIWIRSSHSGWVDNIRSLLSFQKSDIFLVVNFGVLIIVEKAVEISRQVVRGSIGILALISFFGSLENNNISWSFALIVSAALIFVAKSWATILFSEEVVEVDFGGSDIVSEGKYCRILISFLEETSI